MLDKLWQLANIITGFAIVHSLASTIAFAKELKDIQLGPTPVKWGIVAVSVVITVAYCLAILRCRSLARGYKKIFAENDNDTWNVVTRWRIYCVVLFTSLFVLGLFAPEIVNLLGLAKAEAVSPS